ncbi:MAG: hypothetical protein JXR27_05435 [Paludibacteraceae bacterium]|nr:hypothetical protein [Paludibacteraceae bacterium]
MTKHTYNKLFAIAAVLTFGGAIATLLDNIYGKYIFSAGALGIVILQAIQALADKLSPRMQRLHRIGFLASLMLALGAYFMFTGSNSWVVAVLIYALVSLFVSFRSE